MTNVPHSAIIGRMPVIYHEDSDTGPRHKSHPEFNVTAIAREVGMSKSHLAKILNYQGTPTYRALKVLSEILEEPTWVVLKRWETDGRIP